MSEPTDGDSDISPRERAHQRRRDRKRETRMVVDNASIRRVLSAVRRRSPAPRRKPGGSTSADSR